MKLQLALEYIIVFAFVLLTFEFLFALIANQRITVLSNQAFSQLQLVTQSVSSQISLAIQSGDGYSARIPLSGTIGTINYHLFITPGGTVIANATLGKQVIEAIAYSAARSILSNSTFQSGSSQAYQLPISNGTIEIQNSFGTICIDYDCSTQGSYPRTISLSSSAVGAAEFDGLGTSIATSRNVQTSTSTFTVSAWVYADAGNGNRGVVGQGSGNGNWQLKTDSGSWSFSVFGSADDAFGGVRTGNWTFLTAVYDAGSLSLYVNGVSVANYTVSSSMNTASKIYIGYAPGYSGLTHFSGSISDVQVYGAALAPQQVRQLYLGGIAASPLAGETLTAWYPLDGDAKDHGGNGYDGTVTGPVIFPSAVELFANVTDQYGRPIDGALVGFTTTLGAFPTGSSYANLTSNGLAVALLSQGQQGGEADVRATVLASGNSTVTSSLAAWLPFNEGQGSVHDISGSASGIAAYGGSTWPAPASVAGFDGRSAWVQAANSNSLDLSTGGFTAVAWIKTTSNATDNEVFAKGGSCGVGGYKLITFNGHLRGSINRANGAFAYNSIVSQQTVDDGKWHMVAFGADQLGTSSTALSLYIDGIPVAPFNDSLQPESGSVDTSGWTFSVTDPFGIGYSYPSNSLSCPNHFDGSISDVQVYNALISPGRLQELYLEGMSGVPASNGLAAWYPLDGDAVDRSGNGHNGTVLGALSFVSAPQASVPGSVSTSFLAASFNGSNSRLTTPLNQSVSSFAISLWVNPASMSIMDGGFGYTLFNTIGTGNVMMYLSGSGPGAAPGTGDEGFCVGSTCRNGYGIGNASWSMLTVSVSNGRASLYLNGSAAYNVTVPSGPYSLKSLGIGRAETGNIPFNGLVADLQVYDTSVSPSQVSALYREGLLGTPVNGSSGNPRLMAWYPLQGSAKDFGGAGLDAAASNVAYAQQSVAYSAPAALNGYGIGLDGSASYVSESAPKVVLTNGAYNTASFWMYWDGNAADNPTVIAFNSYSLSFNNASRCLGFSSGSGDLYGVPLSLLDLKDRWVFVTAAFYNGAYVRNLLYIDGVPQTMVQCAGASASVAASPLVQVGSSPGNSDYFGGSIADLQVYGTLLGQSQVRQLYASGVSPTASAEAPLGVVR